MITVDSLIRGSFKKYLVNETEHPLVIQLAGNDRNKFIECTKIVSEQGFDEINFVNTFKGHSDYYEGDKETLEIASNWVKDSDYNVIAAHYSGPDKVGHSWGVTGPEYKAKILDLDQQVSDLLKLTPSNWTVIVTADHGMTEIGSHGSAEAVTRNVAAIISGPGILVGSEDSVSQRDLSTLVPLSLGLPFPVPVSYTHLRAHET